MQVNSREKYQKSDGELDPVYAGLTAVEWLNMYNYSPKIIDAKSAGVKDLGKEGRFTDRSISISERSPGFFHQYMV
jgi:hypothetical protein